MKTVGLVSILVVLILLLVFIYLREKMDRDCDWCDEPETFVKLRADIIQGDKIIALSNYYLSLKKGSDTILYIGLKNDEHSLKEFSISIDCLSPYPCIEQGDDMPNDADIDIWPADWKGNATQGWFMYQSKVISLDDEEIKIIPVKILIPEDAPGDYTEYTIAVKAYKEIGESKANYATDTFRISIEP